MTTKSKNWRLAQPPAMLLYMVTEAYTNTFFLRELAMSSFTEIKTPNGKAIKFMLPLRGDVGGERAAYRTRLTTRLLKQKKRACPILATMSGGEQRFIVADFDARNEDQAAVAEQVCIEAAAKHDNCLAFRSVSGNWKCGFLVSSQDWPTHAELIAYLESVLPKEAHWFDRAGMTRLYLGEATAEQLVRGLPGLAAPALPRVGRGGSSIFNKHSKTTAYFMAPASALPLQDLPSHWETDQTRKQLLAILTASWGLATDHGWNLPQLALALQLDCSPMQVSRMLKELRDLGLLILTDKSYRQGSKAMTYKASHQLWRAIQAHKKSHRDRRTSAASTLPSRIENGQFHRLCLVSMPRFATSDDFLNWLDTLDGITPKRLTEAARYWRSHASKNQHMRARPHNTQPAETHHVN